MTAFTRVRMDHHLQPPTLPRRFLSPSIAPSLFALCFPPSILPIAPSSLFRSHPVFRLHHSALRQPGSLNPD